MFFYSLVIYALVFEIFFFFCNVSFQNLKLSQSIHFLKIWNETVVVKNEVVFLELEFSSPRGVKQKKYEKKHEILAFKPLLQEMLLKNLTSRKLIWSSNI